MPVIKQPLMHTSLTPLRTDFVAHDTVLSFISSQVLNKWDRNESTSSDILFPVC